MKSILLFGRVGQVGWELRRTLAPLARVTCVDYPEIDFTRPDSVRAAIAAAAPDIIINAAAYTAVDKAEAELALATQINADAPGVMAAEARKRGSLLVHYSTDYVFDGAAGPYSEEDIAAMAAYVASLAPGPAIPTEEQIDYSDADVAYGGELFRINCAMCHNAAGAGGGAQPGRQNREGFSGDGEGQAGAIQLWLHWHRQRPALRRGAVQSRRRHQRRARAVSRLAGIAHRFDERARAIHFVAAAGGDASD